MQQLSILIEKCWSGKASTDELNELLVRLNSDEAKLLDNWMQMPDGTMHEHQVLFDKARLKQLILSGIKDNNQTPVISVQRSGRSVYLKVAMVAAVITTLFFSGWYLFKLNKEEVFDGVENIASAGNVVVSGSSSKVFTLSDNSEVLLYPNSSLEYDSMYNVNNRKLYLKGKARFTVTKNKEKEFVVYSGKVSTTALGTVFEVDLQNDSTIVLLIEGSVKVQSHSSDSIDVVYLLPGEKAVSGHLISLRKDVWDEPVVHKEKSPAKTRAEKQANNNSEWVFKQMPLEHVLKLLMQEYNIHINYNKSELTGMLFTGKFEKSDTPESILRVIVNINNLKLDIDQNVFTIKK
jgi:transmembrane sensor